MKLKKWFGLGLTIVMCQLLLISYCLAANWNIDVPWKNKTIFYVDTDSIQMIKKI